MPRAPRWRGRGGGDSAGVRYLVPGAQAWHAQAEACAGQMSAVWTSLCMSGLGTSRSGRGLGMVDAFGAGPSLDNA